MKRIRNSTIILITFLIIVIIVGISTILTIKERHDERSIYATRTKIEYYAKRCYLEEKCKDVIKLQDLYDLKYLKEEVYDPITKEVIDPQLEIKYIDNNIVINWE